MQTPNNRNSIYGTEPSCHHSLGSGNRAPVHNRRSFSNLPRQMPISEAEEYSEADGNSLPAHLRRGNGIPGQLLS